MYNFAGIVVNNESIQLDRIFTYKIPIEMSQELSIGNWVKIPFGMGNKLIDGFVFELYTEVQGIKNIKTIASIGSKEELFLDKDKNLILQMRERYLCTYLEAIKMLIPTGIIRGNENKTQNLIFIGKAIDEKYNKEPYLSIYNTVKESNGLFNKSNISKKFNYSLSSINTMLKHGFLILNETVINRYNMREYKRFDEKILTNEQKSAINTILNSRENLFLIHGVTGCGKTEIYMRLVSEMIKNKKSSIILVPEIALTPQMVESFKGRFGTEITVFHSKLSDGERYDEWFRVKQGKVKVAIGARSAIFLPFENLGLIVIDEEHESSYKSDSDPKYNAREIAEIKVSTENCKLVLGSATPSIETYYRAKSGEIKLITINNRVLNVEMPEISVVDMREELKNGNKSMFSKILFDDIKESLNLDNQVILFLNRRGFSTFVSCRKCGFVFKCSKCDISLTYHNESNSLDCHYCGHKEKLQGICPSCKSKYVKYFGVGTEQIEAEVKKYFKEAKPIRMDFDTTRKKNSYEDIYNNFKSKKNNVLVGTQMIAKGLDFKDVTLVGVIAADLSLNLPDYRSAEKTFQLITQVAGRAGRGDKKGRVVIQTYTPNHYAIEHASKNDYMAFYNEEINIRKIMNYPPFSKILLINMSSKNEDLLIKSIQNVGINLKNFFEKSDNINILGPCPCQISKIKEMYRWQIVIKGDVSYKMANEIKNNLYENLKLVYNEVRLSIDINPNNLL